MALTSSLQQAHEWQSTCQTSSFMGDQQTTQQLASTDSSPGQGQEVD